MKTEWTHYKTIIEGEYCGFDGINISDYEWKSDNKLRKVKDPINHEQRVFIQFWIELEYRKVEFVAGEFSNGVWGIFTQKNTETKTEKSLENNFKIARTLTNELDLLHRIRNGVPENEYDFLTTQILSDILNKKGNKEINERAFQLLNEKYETVKVKSKITDFELTISNLIEKIRIKTHVNTI